MLKNLRQLSPETKQLSDAAFHDAASRNDPEVSPEQLLLTLLEEETGRPALLLKGLGIDVGALHREMESGLNPRQEDTPLLKAKAEFDNAVREACLRADASPDSRDDLVRTSLDLLEKFGNSLVGHSRQTRRLMDLAVTEAEHLKSPVVYPEHLLIVLAAEDDSRASEALRAAGGTLEKLRRQFLELNQQEPPARPSLWLRQRAEFVDASLEATEDARNRRFPDVSPEHIVLKLLGQPGSPCARLVEHLELSLVTVQAALEAHLEDTYANLSVTGSPSEGKAVQRPPQAERTDQILFWADKAAELMGAYFVGGADYLVALVQEPGGFLAGWFPEHGVELGAVLSAAKELAAS